MGGCPGFSFFTRSFVIQLNWVSILFKSVEVCCVCKVAFRCICELH